MKNLLFIGISYYDYTQDIINLLVKNDYNVKYYPIEPRNLYYLSLRTISKYLHRKAIDKYHSSILKKEKLNKYDIVFFLQIHHFSIKNLVSLKNDHLNSRFLLYNWDSISTHDYRNYIKYFNKIATFDPVDAINLDINYLPLFCSSSISKLISKAPYKYDIYFIGSIRSLKRYNELNKFKIYCKKLNLNFFYFFHCSPVMFLKLLYNGVLPLDISFFSINRKKMYNILQESKAVFDFANHSQNGYTMRIFENLCLGKKIITNNLNIKSEKFYSPDRILIIEDSNYSEIKNFLGTDLKDPYNTFSEYHLENWLKNLLNK